jgi:hypothetical protein
MQSNLESGSFNRPGLVLPYQGRAVASRDSRKRPASLSPMKALWSARSDALRAQRWEDFAWLGLALCALALLVESFR